jgi:hypothetical protein
MDVANIANRAKNERQQNGGELNPQQRTTIENLLNQSLAIKSNTAMGVGTAVPAGANPLGAKLATRTRRRPRPGCPEEEAESPRSVAR